MSKRYTAYTATKGCHFTGKWYWLLVYCDKIPMSQTKMEEKRTTLDQNKNDEKTNTSPYYTKKWVISSTHSVADLKYSYLGKVII